MNIRNDYDAEGRRVKNYQYMLFLTYINILI